MMATLIEAAVDHVRESRGRVVEAYPVEPGSNLTGDRGYQGIVSAFLKAGFSVAGRMTNGRAIVRREV